MTKSAENYKFLSKANKKFKKYEELWSKIIDLIRSINKNSDDYNKHQFNSDDELLLIKTKNIPSMLLELFFKYYPQVF